MVNYSILELEGEGSSSCGYCGPSGERSSSRSSFKFGLEAHQLTPFDYQKMIDRGWRRSGTYCYKPDLARSCCPQYTIRLEALNFKSSRSQRKVVYRFNRFLRGESEAKINATHDDSKRAPGAMDVDANPSPPAPQSPPSGSSGTVNPPSKSPRRRNQKNNGVQSAPHGQASSKLTDEAVTTSPATKDKSKDNNATTFSLIEEIHSVDARFVPESVKLAHHWEVTLEFSAYSQEKFDLFCKYQDVIHNEPEKQEDGFARFLCVSPIPGNLDIPYTSPDVPQHLPKKYGSYHQMYRLDGELIAMGVIDILPNCVSSVYLMYDPTWEAYSLGKLSALTEIALAQEMAQYGAPGMAYTYMGFYVHVCPKMRYKGDYGPSYLLDPETYNWYPMEGCKTLLDKWFYIPFSDPSRATRPMDNDEGRTKGLVPTPLTLLDESVVEKVRLGRMSGGSVYVVSIAKTAYWTHPRAKEYITRAATLLGEEVISTAILIT